MVVRGWLLLAALAFVVSGAAPAFGHAERTSSSPDAKAKVDEAPAEVTVSFTEPPIADADLQVFDGCKTDVVDDLDVQGTEITAALSGGQPGRWRVAFHVVSGIDGHATRDAYTFTVRGTKDCSAGADDPPPAGDGPRDEEEGGGAGALIALFAGGTVLVVVIALLLRGKKPS